MDTDNFLRQEGASDMFTVVAVLMAVPVTVWFLLTCLYLVELYGDQILALLERVVS